MNNELIIHYVKDNIHRVAARKCQCGNSLKILTKDIWISGVLVKKVPYLRCSKCRRKQKLSLVMFALQEHIKHVRFKGNVNAMNLFGKIKMEKKS
ncbi:MAG: hypothetical protein ACH0QD_05335 [Tepidibacillus sp.]